MLNPYIQKAYELVFNNRQVDRELALELSKIEGAEILDLISLAHKIQLKYNISDHVCTILNAKSGACSQDCSYCSQSSFNKAEVEIYPILSKEKMLDAAATTYNNGVRTFGIVTSGWGYKTINNEFQYILETVDEIYSKFPDMQVCASLGILSDETAKALADHKIVEYNHNLQVNTAKYKDLIATKHTIEERIETVKLVKKYGIKVCCGGIIGLGETMEDRIELALQLSELDSDVIPINVLIPIKGTKVENVKLITAAEVAKTFALFRIINPTKTIKFAAGRETRMKDFQGLLLLSGANGILTGGYLTTRGRDTEEDDNLLQEISNFN